jgi:hypothetical protein
VSSVVPFTTLSAKVRTLLSGGRVHHSRIDFALTIHIPIQAVNHNDPVILPRDRFSAPEASPNVDVALTWNTQKQKAPRHAKPKALVLFGIFGFGSMQPTIFAFRCIGVKILDRTESSNPAWSAIIPIANQ